MGNEIETFEDYVKRLAYNRWTFRQHYKWELWKTDRDDYLDALEQARREEMRDGLMKPT